MTEAYLSVHGIWHSFGDFTALKGIDLDIPQGSFVTLLGPSGCGKTTLLRIIAGFYQQDKGTVTIQGRTMDGLPPHKRDTPLVFQDYALFPHMTIEENIGYGLKVKDYGKDEIKQRVARQLDIFGLTGMERRYPRQLSGGQQQRVAFARALVMERDILLLDEPLSNLDAKLRIEVRAQLRSIQKKLGMTAIYVTHDQEEALAMSDIVAVLDRGVIQQVGSPQDIYFRPANRFVASFIGSGDFIAVEEKRSPASGGTDIRIMGAWGHIPQIVPEGAATALIRPGSLILTPPGGGDIQAQVVDVVFQGTLRHYVLNVGGEIVHADIFSNAPAYEIGTQVGLSIVWDDIHVLRD